MSRPPHALARALLAHGGGGASIERDAAAVDALDRALGALVAHGRAAWPTVPLAGEAFAAYLGGRVGAGPPPDDPLAALARLRADDLYLTCACLQRAPEAFGAFDAAFIAKVPTWLARLRGGAELADETQQRLREKLFVGVGAAPPKLAQYSGKGPLESWVRVAAMRTALNVIDGIRAEAPVDEERDAARELFTPCADLELDYIKARHRGAFQAALRGALAALGKRERTLLRFHFLEGLPPERIATIYDVHRTTAMRWLAAIQEQVLAETRRRLGEALEMQEQECESLIGLLRSHLQVTLQSLLESVPR